MSKAVLRTRIYINLTFYHTSLSLFLSFLSSFTLSFHCNSLRAKLKTSYFRYELHNRISSHLFVSNSGFSRVIESLSIISPFNWANFSNEREISSATRIFDLSRTTGGPRDSHWHKINEREKQPI